MDNIVRDVNETWDNARPANSSTLQYVTPQASWAFHAYSSECPQVQRQWRLYTVQGTRFYVFSLKLAHVRLKFEEYVTAALASVKYADFLTKGQRTDVIITGAGE